MLLWWLATTGVGAEDRFISPVILPSPGEVRAQLSGAVQGAGAPREHRGDAAAACSSASAWRRWSAIPLGIIAGSWRVFEAAAAPIALFGRNLPVAALIPLTILWFGIDETQKVMFIFIACVPFVYSDVGHRDRVACRIGMSRRRRRSARTRGRS